MFSPPLMNRSIRPTGPWFHCLTAMETDNCEFTNPELLIFPKRIRSIWTVRLQMRLTQRMGFILCSGVFRRIALRLRCHIRIRTKVLFILYHCDGNFFHRNKWIVQDSLVSTYVVCERLSVMHQPARLPENFDQILAEHPCSGISHRTPPLPKMKNSNFLS